ncbi:LysR family transcriptional regulator [Pseudonocardia broussonetiae]|uniref:LysR family transcriptional regulator n=1 Tax=Pseudonocardia broussonetiae TaxID=2736640 RepID=UPI0019627491|nr:LysR family transcriptional regulator [Pseudonocardia broussonetiae]
MALDVSTQALRSLRAVARTGSFTGAAELLGYTQSAVSKQVRALENAAGAVLFTRAARGVAPTAAGRALLRRAEVVLDQLDAAQHDIAALGRQVVGRVTLGGFPTTAVDLVPRALAHLGSTRPDVDVDFRQLSTPAQLRRLRSGRLDLAVIAVGDGLPDYDLRGLTTRTLPSGPLLVAVPAGHRLAGIGRVSLADLAAERWVVGQGAEGEPQFGVWPALEGSEVVARARDWSTRLGFVAAGLGVTTIPALAAAAVPGGVVTVRVDDPAPRERRLTLAWTGEPGPAVAAVRAALATAAAAMAEPWSDPA